MFRENSMENICYEWCLGNVLSSRRMCKRRRRASRIWHPAGHRARAIGAVSKQHCETKVKENLKQPGTVPGSRPCGVDRDERDLI